MARDTAGSFLLKITLWKRNSWMEHKTGGGRDNTLTALEMLECSVVSGRTGGATWVKHRRRG